MVYKKYYEDENIKVGDLISYMRIEDKVIRSEDSHYIKPDLKVIGVCTKVDENEITVRSTGVYDINITGMVCIGDKLTASSKAGKANAIKYKEDETNFNSRSIGKVIGLYNDYSKAKVLLDIE